MIRVTRLDRQEIALNCDLIETVESHPDTTLRLVTGLSLVVRESPDEVLERIRDWRASLFARAGIPALLATSVPITLLPRPEELVAGSADAARAHDLLEIPA